MNKNDLVSAVADSSGLTKADAGRAVDECLIALPLHSSLVVMFVL